MEWLSFLLPSYFTSLFSKCQNDIVLWRLCLYCRRFSTHSHGFVTLSSSLPPFLVLYQLYSQNVKTTLSSEGYAYTVVKFLRIIMVLWLCQKDYQKLHVNFWLTLLPAWPRPFSWRAGKRSGAADVQQRVVQTDEGKRHWWWAHHSPQQVNVTLICCSRTSAVGCCGHRN